MAKNKKISKELKNLENEAKKSKLILDLKKNKFADEIKAGLGDELINEIINPKKKPKLSFWKKLFKMFSS